VDPLGLVAKGGTWYLVARTSEGFRTFRVSRIEDARVLDRPAKRPADFDLATYWKESTEELRKGRGRYAVTLHLDARAAESLKKWRSALPEQLAGPDAAGRVTLRLQFDDEEQALFVVLGHGPRADVVEPASLRDRVATDRAAAFRGSPPS